MKIVLTGAAALSLCAGTAAAQVDGLLTDPGFGSPLWTTVTGTGFGNSTDPSADRSDGSEIDAVYSYISGGNLHLGVAGNIGNFNKLELFFDVRSGGQNQLRFDNADVDFNQLNDKLGGLTFDTGFEPDYFITYTMGDDNGSRHFSAAAVLDSAGGGPGGFQGGGLVSDGAISAGGARGLGGYTIDGDHSNILGVNSTGAPFDSDPATVTTGIELQISLAELGWDGVSPILLASFVNGGSHDFVSNQIVGDNDPNQGNLGNDMNGNFIDGSLDEINFNNLAGTQYITIPAPGSLALLTLGGLAAARRRR